MDTASQNADPDEERRPARRDDDERRPARRDTSKVLRDEREDDADDVMQWLNAQAGEQACKLRIDRKHPRMGPNGENISGVLETLEEKIEDVEGYLRDTWGGGLFQLQVSVPNAIGGWKYGKARSIRIAGPPKMLGMPLIEGERAGAHAAAVAAAGEPLADRAIGVSQHFANAERARADRLERDLNDARANAGRGDMEALKVMMAPYQAQLDAQREENKALRAQLIAEANKPTPTDPFRDRMLENAVDGQNQRTQDLVARYEQRLDKLRDDHASELRQLRTNHEAEAKRAEDRHDRSLEAIRKDADRALDDTKAGHARELKQNERGQSSEQKALEIANQARIDTLKSEKDRLSHDMVELRAELGKLRERKDKTPAEQVKELASLKESMDVLTGGGDDDGDKPWYERLAGALGNSEVAMRVVDRIAGTDPDEDDEDAKDKPPPAKQQQVQQQVMYPPVNQLVRNPEDGQVYIHRGNGMYEGPVDEKRLRALAVAKKRRAAALVGQQRKGAAAPAAAAEAEAETSAEGDAIEAALAEIETPLTTAASSVARPNPRPVAGLSQPHQQAAQPQGRPKGKRPTPEEIKAAVEFLESAVGSSAKPESIARTARSLVPGRTLAYIRAVGVDNFLNTVAHSKPASPLVTQHGRLFVRAVAKSLFEGPA